MHSAAAVAEVFALRAQGFGARRIASRANLPVSTVRDWLAGRVPRHARVDPISAQLRCDTCGHEAHRFAELPSEYVYLLGVYLGDGCISEHARQVFRLRLFLDLRYPEIVKECEVALRLIMPRSKVNTTARYGHYVRRTEPSHVEISAFSKSWPCLFPQHGPGRKHERSIELLEWQWSLVRCHAGVLLRGLIHSDGCRFTNTGTNWTCPRYSFANRSDDIRRIFCETCDLLNLRYTFAPQTIYVSRKADVEILDRFVGPKR